MPVGGVRLHPTELLKQFEEIDKITEEEKEHIKFLIQAVIDKNRFMQLAQAV